MTFNAFKPGNFQEGERLLHDDHMNYVNEKLPYCLDGESGGTYTPSAALSVTQLQCPTTPATGNAVANKTYCDAGDAATLASANSYTDGEVSSVNAQFSQGSTSSAGNASDLVGISAVSTLRVQWVRFLNTYVLSVLAVVTNSVTGTKQFRVNLTALDDAFSASHVVGSGDAFHASTDNERVPVTVSGPSSTDDYIVLTWRDTETSGTSNISAVAVYYAQ